jgi:catechol 2,3-dioxygenase-like lactoylglutathione lyase family enzyme
MKRPVLLLAALLCCSYTSSSDAPKRPRIFGIEGVSIYVSDAHKARAFYDALLDQDQRSKHPKHSFWREKPPAFSLSMSPNRFQFIGLEPAHSPTPSNLIAEVTFLTDNVAALRNYLLANLTDTRSLTGPGMKYLSLTDPEGHRISFLETDGVLKDPKIIAILTKGGYENEIIHAGFIVHDRGATEHFYKDILGFRPYWHGGMKDDQTDWVSMQVPDGTDWLEFMVNVEPDADQRLRGIMNHIAIGVTDIHATQKKLMDSGIRLTEEPQIGRDGKWQLNLYDPDETRVEFMEFAPTQKPCCSEFTGPHPGSKQ